jgi:hypothetical protein
MKNINVNNNSKLHKCCQKEKTLVKSFLEKKSISLVAKKNHQPIGMKRM